MYSNLSLVLEIEAQVSGIQSFGAILGKNGFRIESSSIATLDELAERNSDDLVIGTIQVTFATGDGSLIIPVPSVPG